MVEHDDARMMGWIKRRADIIDADTNEMKSVSVSWRTDC